MNKYAKRLLEEWKQHGKIIISVDYDDTIYPWRKDFNEEDIARTIDLVKIAHSTGAYIVIFTASDTDRYDEIKTHCDKIKLPIDAINKNAIPLPYGNNGKIYYNINLCDRSGLVESLDILQTAMYAYRSYKYTKSLTTDVA